MFFFFLLLGILKFVKFLIVVLCDVTMSNVTFTGDLRVTLEARRALATERAGQVAAEGTAAANRSRRSTGSAFVDVHTGHFGVACVTGWTGTFISSIRVPAEAIGPAGVAQLAFVNVSALPPTSSKHISI